MSYYGKSLPGRYNTWAWFNQQNALATIDPVSKYLVWRHPGPEASANNWSAYLLPATVTNGDSYYSEMAFSVLFGGVPTTFGLCMYNENTDEIIANVAALDGVGFQTGMKAFYQASHGGGQSLADFRQASGAMPIIWTRLVVDGEQGRIYSDISLDGILWRRIADRSRNLEATHFGVYSSVGTSGTFPANLGVVYHIREVPGNPEV